MNNKHFLILIIPSPLLTVTNISFKIYKCKKLCKNDSKIQFFNLKSMWILGQVEIMFPFLP